MSYVLLFFSFCTIITNAGLVIVNKIWQYSDTRRGKQKALLGAGILIISYICLAIVQQFKHFFFVLSVIIISKTFLDSTITEALFLRTKNENRGLVFSTSDNLYLFFDIICPLISSSLIELVGYKISYLISSLIMVSGSLGFYYHKNKH